MPTVSATAPATATRRPPSPILTHRLRWHIAAHLVGDEVFTFGRPSSLYCKRGQLQGRKVRPPLPPASSAFPSPPFSLSPLHACAGAPPLPLSPRAPPPEQVDRDDRSSPTVELRSPGSSFCWGPELQGSTSPSSSWSSTQRRAERDRHEVRRARDPAPPARAPATPPASRTGPAPSRRLAPPMRRFHAARPTHLH